MIEICKGQIFSRGSTAPPKLKCPTYVVCCQVGMTVCTAVGEVDGVPGKVCVILFLYYILNFDTVLKSSPKFFFSFSGITKNGLKYFS